MVPKNLSGEQNLRKKGIWEFVQNFLKEPSELLGFWILSIVWYSKKLKDTGPVISFQGTQQSRCLAPHLRMETDPVSETLCSLFFSQYRMMSKAQKPNNSKCHTP
jgi:hypothetical protein